MTGTANRSYLSLLFLIVGIACLILSRHAAIGDFGNYYYGSRMLLDGKFSAEMYNSVDYFNTQIASYGETNFFEDYIPVPPLSAVLYIPFCWFESSTAKLLFNSLNLLLFCLNLYRLQKLRGAFSKLSYLLPLVFFYPLYSNIVQGQTYLFLCAILMEVFIRTEKKQTFIPALFLALAISLKLTPAILILYFLIRKEYLIAVQSLFIFVLLQGLLCLVLPPGLVINYFTQIVPRLLDNDVVGTFYHGNQSAYTVFLRMFVRDGISNPEPLFNNPWPLILMESFFLSGLLGLIYAARRSDAFTLYGFIIFCSLLCSRYIPGYSTLLTLPLCLSMTNVSAQIKPAFLSFLFLAICLSIPIGNHGNSFFFIKFARLEGLIVMLLFAIILLKLKPDWRVVVVLFLPMLIFKYLSFPVRAVTYFPIQNTKGLLYDLELRDDSLFLKSSTGYAHVTESFLLKSKAEPDTTLILKGHVLYYQGKVIDDLGDNKLKPFVYEGKYAVFMSDMNQGIRFYKLRYVPL